MAWAIPSLEDIAQRTRTAFTTYLPATNFNVWPSAAGVSAKVISARIWELFHRQDYIAKQAYPLTATGEYLERHAQSYGLARKVDLKATGYVYLIGGTHTTEIPTGTQFQDAAGLIYTTTEVGYIASDGSATIPVEADATGEDYNQSASATLSMLAVIAGAPASGEVTADGIYGGSAIESDDELRQRLLQRLRYPPNAGSKTDYERWAGEIPGVTRTWVEGNAFGPGTVALYFMMDDTYTDGIPNAADVANVQAYIDSVKPITANVTVAAPIPEPLTIEVTGLSPFTTTVIANVKAELEAVIKAKAEVSTPLTTSYFRVSWIWQAISNATGERYHTVVLPASDYAVPQGRIPVYDESFVKLES